MDLLEERRLLSVSSPGDESALVASPLDDAAVAVVGRHTFYNNSRFDNYTLAQGPTDATAIATDKEALLPGQTATFANYTSYASGINGVMIDVSGLSGGPTLADFEFRMGNSGQAEQWADAPAPLSINVQPGGGVDGSTRISFVWADGTIKNQWLQVTVRATANTGLTSPDVFYFGNAVGETGDSATSAETSAIDEALTRENSRGFSNPAAITSLYDFDRDGLVNEADEIITGTAYNGQGGVLELITADADPGAVPAASAASDPTANPANATSDSAASTPAFVDFVSADVVGRYVFYNHSQFDDVNPAANADDDAAIATDKAALLPGQAATLSNYTNYSRGLNGVMIDIDGLSGSPTLDDFQFLVSASAAPGTWTTAPEPISLTVRRGEGVDGADRVTVIWADNAIENTWLEVTVSASTSTGLKEGDVFYFGNLIGDAGGNSSRPIVSTVDQIATRNSPYSSLDNPAPVTAPADYNRDQIVNEADEWIARVNLSLPAFRLFGAQTAETTVEATRPPVDLIHFGDNGHYTTFAANIVKANDGSLLYIAHARYSDKDYNTYALVMKRSFDNGVSWTPLSTIYEVPVETVPLNGPAAVVDQETGEIFVLFTKSKRVPYVMSSTDNGLTWSTPKEITDDVKVTATGNPNPDVYSDTPWDWYAIVPASAIQLQNGDYAGRLMVAGVHRFASTTGGTSWAHVIYSDDHGETWKLGGGPDPAKPVNGGTNEAQLVEGADGSVYMNIRLKEGVIRGSSRSYDGGLTWTDNVTIPNLITGEINGSMVRVNENTVLFAATDSFDGARQKMTLWVSHDDMVTWTKTKTVFFGYSAYSDMVLVDHETVLLVFNGDRQDNDWKKHTYLVRFNLDWLETPEPYQFTWHFNEKDPGELTDLNGTSIYDDSLWDNRAMPLADSAAEAPQYVEGPNGHTALRLTSGSDRVKLTPELTRALMFEADESFTVELTLRTTDSTGIIIGTFKDKPGWTLALEDGHLSLSLANQKVHSTIVSTDPINDGLWHQIVAVRDASNDQFMLLVDGEVVATGLNEAFGSLYSKKQVTLGSYEDGTGQLAFDIDVLRVTRAVLPSSEYMSIDLAEPPRYPAPTYASDAPDSISGLQLWVPAYDYAHFFGDLYYGDTLALDPPEGASVRSAIDASSNAYKLTAFADSRGITYTEDSVVGPNWSFDTVKSTAGRLWQVTDSNGTSDTNFDFVQNTGEFTISTFVKLDKILGYAVLFDTADATGTNPGFTLKVNANGSVQLTVNASDSEQRYNETSFGPRLTVGTWYHVAVVGNGVGNPVTFYVTPVTSAAVNALTIGTISGPDGNYATDAAHNLTIASLSDTHAALSGNMVDQAIYNRALSYEEIQQLFEFTKDND